ncbi:hypothetical protein IE53DRAFT_252421 [Violaceomyces palustris]|uniref:Uncharacterized protein n=1 Tax=Violaceomyces palustris TaxID=1673888 RepID=A0ACD0NNN8_9BASI|nr:hypothetical protein IE53DRAFT_252421 [Violaceomyces palustris]
MLCDFDTGSLRGLRVQGSPNPPGEGGLRKATGRLMTTATSRFTFSFHLQPLLRLVDLSGVNPPPPPPLAWGQDGRSILTLRHTTRSLARVVGTNKEKGEKKQEWNKRWEERFTRHPQNERKSRGDRTLFPSLLPSFSPSFLFVVTLAWQGRRIPPCLFPSAAIGIGRGSR